jgi:hypothetical protein
MPAIAFHADFRNCQEPAPDDAGQSVARSASMILDGHNCAWLMQYPHEALAGGSMYAVHLHAHIPVAGSPGGPPLPSAFREFGGAPFDVRGFFSHVYQHPDDLPRAMLPSLPGNTKRLQLERFSFIDCGAKLKQS